MMSRNKHSAIPVFAVLLAILATTAFVGMSGESSFSRAEPVAIVSDQDVIAIELDQLSVFLDQLEPFSPAAVPQTVRSLENKRIRIRGYMLAFNDKEIATFTLNGEISHETAMADLRSGRTGLCMNTYISVDVRKGHETEYLHEPFIVEGILRIEPEIINGRLRNLFRIDDATLVPTKPRDGFQRAFGSRC